MWLACTAGRVACCQVCPDGVVSGPRGFGANLHLGYVSDAWLVTRCMQRSMNWWRQEHGAATAEILMFCRG